MGLPFLEPLMPNVVRSSSFELKTGYAECGLQQLAEASEALYDTTKSLENTANVDVIRSVSYRLHICSRFFTHAASISALRTEYDTIYKFAPVQIKIYKHICINAGAFAVGASDKQLTAFYRPNLIPRLRKARAQPEPRSEALALS